MRKSNLDKIKKFSTDDNDLQGTALEEILYVIREELEKSYKENDANESYPELCEDLLKGIELCDKLLGFDYFKKSEEYLDSVPNSLNYKLFRKSCTTWEKIYKKEVKVKAIDLSKLFKIIEEHFEEI